MNPSFDHILKSPAFVIHLEKETARKPFFMKSISEAGFQDIRIVPAINAYNKKEIEDALHLFKNPKIHTTVSKGGIGCLLSHLKLLKYIIDEKMEIATIFEDDVFFHPHWNNLAPGYFQRTPKDFDILFIGNQIDECLELKPLPNRITQCSNFCTHAYIITQKGAQKLLQLLLTWDWWSNDTAWVLPEPPAFCGLYYIDVMIKNIQIRILQGKLSKKTLIWYCWNGMHYPCSANKRPLTDKDTRNTGLVFQCDKFPSSI